MQNVIGEHIKTLRVDSRLAVLTVKTTRLLIAVAMYMVLGLLLPCSTN